MASDESLTTMVDSCMQDDENDDTGDGLHQNRQSSLSRLSVCTSSIYDDDEDDDVVNNPSDVGMFMSRLSLESFDGADADGEVSEVDKGIGVRGRSSEVTDSDEEPGFYSLPATPPRRRRKIPPVSGGLVANKTDSEGRDSESEKDGRKCNFRRERRAIREKTPWMDKKREYNTNNGNNNDNKEAASGESDGEHGGGGGGGGGGLMVLTRPKGGKRSLCMGFEEVKACRDLGFELEVIPGRVSISPIGSGSTVETQTSSDGNGNSPIANWRISSPGDDPKEVKARLKVWAQAVALASTSRHVS